MSPLPDFTRRINSLLSEAYTAAGIRIWWSARNRNLGGATPASLLLTGSDEDRQRLLAEAERISGGAA